MDLLENIEPSFSGCVGCVAEHEHSGQERVIIRACFIRRLTLSSNRVHRIDNTIVSLNYVKQANLGEYSLICSEKKV